MVVLFWAGLRCRLGQRTVPRGWASDRPRRRATRASEIELSIPKLRRGSYFPTFLDPCKRSEQALVAVVQEAYVVRISTRKVVEVVESVGLRIEARGVDRSGGSTP